MHWKRLLVSSILITAAVYLVGGQIPGGIVLVIGLGLTAAQYYGLGIVERLQPVTFDWRMSAMSAVWLFVFGMFFDLVLVMNGNDNAYLWVKMMAFCAWFVGAWFLLAAVSAFAFRRFIYSVGLGLFWLIFVVGIAGFAFALVMIPSQGYTDGGIFTSHLIGLVLMLATAYVVGFRLPHKMWTAPAPPPEAPESPEAPPAS